MNPPANILGLILARGGSKRIPKKNIKLLNDKPLIAWTIETAIASKSFARVVVSTDDPEIASVARSYGAEVPWMRPQSISHDESTSIEAIIFCIEALRSEGYYPDGIMLLQPTSPFRRISTIHNAIDLYYSNNMRPVVSFDPVKCNPEWCFRLSANRVHPLLGWDAVSTRSQDIPLTLQLNGLIYLAAPAQLLQANSFLDKDLIPILSDNQDETIDIDTIEDWEKAELIASKT